MCKGIKSYAKKYYETDKAIGVEPSRAYYIPFGKSDKKSYDREESSRFISLNGTWKITAYESVTAADGFWTKEGEKNISVPSCVQYYGYDCFQYTNIRYPFPFDPPHVPAKNPAYHYSRKFTWKKDGEKAYIVFEGVDSCFYLYVNGKFVGFSQISHRISEFDITKYPTKSTVKKLRGLDINFHLTGDALKVLTYLKVLFTLSKVGLISSPTEV